MIEGRPDTRGLAGRLARRSAQLARAAAETRLRARRRDGWRWRKAALLWPLLWEDR